MDKMIIEKYSRSPVIDASAVSDDDLKQILLTDDAVRFALCREICRSEG